eukprot:103304-Chlamydomonas_euryale.AAC.1
MRMPAAPPWPPRSQQARRRAVAEPPAPAVSPRPRARARRTAPTVPGVGLGKEEMWGGCG